jgi:predicted ATPase
MARELGEQCLSLAQRLQDDAYLMETHFALGGPLLWGGEVAAARTHLEQGIALYNPQKHRALAFHYGQDPGASSLAYAAHALWLLGYPDQSRQRMHEALALARELAHPLTLVAVLVYAGMLHAWCREALAAQDQAEEAVTLASEQGFPQFAQLGTIVQGWARVEQGHREEGIDQIRQGMAARRASGIELAWPWLVALLTEASGKVDQVDEGLGALAEALVVVERTGERITEVELHRLKGELLWSRSVAHHTEAETCLHHALDVARHQQTKSLELRAATSLARLWQAQDKRQDAHDLLAPVYDWFTEGFDTADLQAAKTLLDELTLK